MEPMTAPHLDDGDLLCLLDGEPGAATRRDAAAHLDACVACRARMERYRLRRDRLGVLLVHTDVPVPASGPRPSASADPASAAPAQPGAADSTKVIPLRPRDATTAVRWTNRPWLRAAAVVLLLLAAAAVATPARAWIVHWVGRQWESVAGGAPSAPRPRVAPAPEAAPAPVQTSAQIRFVPAGGELRVEVAHPQAAGALTLVRVDGPAAFAEVMGTQAVELLVVPSGLRIRNTAATVAAYRIQVPDGVHRVRVRVGGREIVVARADIGPTGRVIPLTGGPG